MLGWSPWWYHRLYSDIFSRHNTIPVSSSDDEKSADFCLFMITSCVRSEISFAWYLHLLSSLTLLSYRDEMVVWFLGSFREFETFHFLHSLLYHIYFSSLRWYSIQPYLEYHSICAYFISLFTSWVDEPFILAELFSSFNSCASKHELIAFIALKVGSRLGIRGSLHHVIGRHSGLISLPVIAAIMATLSTTIASHIFIYFRHYFYICFAFRFLRVSSWYWWILLHFIRRHVAIVFISKFWYFIYFYLLVFSTVLELFRFMMIWYLAFSYRQYFEGIFTTHIFDYYQHISHAFHDVYLFSKKLFLSLGYRLALPH